MGNKNDATMLVCGCGGWKPIIFQTNPLGRITFLLVQAEMFRQRDLMWFQIRVAALRLSPKEHPVYCIVWSCSKTQLSLPHSAFQLGHFDLEAPGWGAVDFRAAAVESSGSPKNRLVPTGFVTSQWRNQIITSSLVWTGMRPCMKSCGDGSKHAKTYEEPQTIPIFGGWRSVDYQLHRSLF